MLTTGRILYHYNAVSMTFRSEGMLDISGEGFIEMHKKDAARLGIGDGERVRVQSRRGPGGEDHFFFVTPSPNTVSQSFFMEIGVQPFSAQKS